MKLKNFFLSCSSGSRSKRLREEQRKYENLRPLPTNHHHNLHNHHLEDCVEEGEVVSVVDVVAPESLMKNSVGGGRSKSKGAGPVSSRELISTNSHGSSSGFGSASASSNNSSNSSSSSANKGKKSKGNSKESHHHRPNQPKSLWNQSQGHLNQSRSRNLSSGHSSNSSATRFYVDCPCPSSDSLRHSEHLSSASSPEEIGVKIGDRVVWLRESPHANESGRVKWKGVINNEEIAGIEFDRELGLGSGWYRNQQLFSCQPNRGGLVAVAGLILEEDYYYNPGSNLEHCATREKLSSSPSSSPSPSSNSSASLEIGPFQSSPDILGAEGPIRPPVDFYQGSVVRSDNNSSDKVTLPPNGVGNSRGQLLERLTRPGPPPPGIYGLYDFPGSDIVDFKKSSVKREQSSPNGKFRGDTFEVTDIEENRSTQREFRFPPSSADWEKSSSELEARLNATRHLKNSREFISDNTIPKPSDSFGLDLGDGDGDKRWQTENNRFSSRKQEPSENMPTLPFVQTPLKEEDVERINGRAKGIQGHRNSCYLDATLFSMFSFTGVFDSILLQDYNWHNKDSGDEELARQVQKILRDEIVSPLRKTMYCSANNVMKLRETMQHLDDKLTAEEMDPQEFLQLLFSKVLHLEEFMSLSSGQSDFFHQVLVQQTEDDKSKIPTIQQLFEQSLIMQDLKLKSTPVPALILQMPRSGNKYKMYDGILPNLTIDITDLMENTPRTCIICGGLATYECPHCYGKFDSGGGARDSSLPQVGSGAESTAFCETCLQQSHMRKRQSHVNNFVKIKYSFDTSYYFPDPNNPNAGRNGHGHPFGAADLYPPHHNPTQISNFALNGALGGGGSAFNGHSRNPTHPVIPFHAYPSTTIPRVTMDLFAVICIETSHFVSFVKCGTDRKAPWVFFDSMADRVENPNGTGHNVPQVKMLPKMGVWLEQLEKDPNTVKKSWENMTPELRRLLSDPYICLYYSPQSSMYS